MTGGEILKVYYPPLAVDYIEGKERARSLFPFAPDEEGITRCAGSLSRKGIAPEVVRVLDRQNRACGCADKARANLDAMKRGAGCITVVTGQQAGLFGGPLYVPFKVIRAVHLAERLREALSRPVVPVFWIETNDHDFEEIRTVDFIDGSNALQRLAWNPAKDPALSCGYVRVDRAAVELVERFCNALRRTGFTEEVRDILLDAYREGGTLAEAALRTAVSLFSSLGTVCLDASDPEFKALMQPILRRECTLSAAGERDEVFHRAAQRLEERGYEVTVHRKEGRVHAFLDEDGRRVPLFRRGGAITDGRGRVVEPGAARLTPMVLSRNICQDALLNTAVYVAGPGEICYLAVVRDFYDLHGVTMPVVYPRYMGTLVDRGTARRLARLGKPPEFFILTPRDKAVRTAFRDAAAVDVDVLEDRLEEKCRAFVEEVKAEIPEAYRESCAPLAGPLYRRVRHAVGGIAGRIRKEEKERAAAATRRAEAASDFLLPHGKLQERVLNIFQFMNLYGGGTFPAALSAVLYGSDEGHNVWKIE